MAIACLRHQDSRLPHRSARLSSVPLLIAVTAHAFPEQRQAIIDAGFSDFLVKPIDMTDLEQSLIRAYMERCGDREVSKQQLLL